MVKKAERRSTAGQDFCPLCGADRPFRIAYGYPSASMWQAHERGEIVLGGCVVEEGSPTLSCRQCGLQWGGPPSRIDGIAAVFAGEPEARPADPERPRPAD